MLKRFILTFFSAFLLVIIINGQQEKAERQTADQPLPEALAKPPLDSRYSSGARPFGEASAFNAYAVVSGQPFRAEVNARLVESKPYGIKMTSEYHGIVARDSQGRVFREQLASPQVPDADGHGASFNAHAVTIVDPLTKIETKWDEMSKIAYESTPRQFYENRQPLDRCEMDQTGYTAARNYPNDKMQRSERLGERTIRGFLTRGCRVYTTISADQSPDKSSYTIIDETWTSPELRVVLLQIRRDPNGEDEIIQLDNVTRREPDAAIFQPPPDYRILDPQGKDLPTAALSAEKALHPSEFTSPISVAHQGDSVVLTIDHPRPLEVAVDFLRLKYGWKIDYEEPPNIAELIDLGNSKWIAAGQPKPRPGTLITVGGSFQSDYAESLAQTAADGEKQILEKIVADYNRSGNPGKYTVQQESNNRFAVVGISLKDKNGKEKNVVPVLNTLITIPAAQRSGSDTIELILSELSKKSGIPVEYFGIADNGLMQSKVIVGGENISARTLLLQVIGETATTRNWSLLYDVNNGGLYGFNTSGYSIKYAPR